MLRLILFSLCRGKMLGTNEKKDALSVLQAGLFKQHTVVPRNLPDRPLAVLYVSLAVCLCFFLVETGMCV